MKSLAKNCSVWSIQQGSCEFIQVLTKTLFFSKYLLGPKIWKIVKDFQGPMGTLHNTSSEKQDAQLSQRDRAAECVIVFAKSRTLEQGDNDLRTL